MPLASRLRHLAPSTFPGINWRWVSYLVLGVGLLLRLVVWGQQRSMVLDEANLVRNFVERSYDQLFQPLGYEQYAPPLFSVIVKACIGAFGNNELTVRLFPLLCSMATLMLFRRLAWRWLAAPFACLALAFVGFGSLFLDYATECKQYASDGLVALALLEAAHWASRRRFTPAVALALAGLGMAAVWLSMPAVFVLAGVGLWLLTESLRDRDYRKAALVAAVGAGWGLSFLAYFFLLLKTSAGLSNLQTFHREYFLAFPPLSKDDWHLLGAQLQLIADRAIGKTVLAVALCGVGFAVGAWHAIVKLKEPFWLFLVPILACLAASALRYYSLIPRLTLFFLPLVVLLVFLGFTVLSTRRLPRLLLVVLSVVVLGNQQRLRAFFSPFYGDYAEVRDGLEYIAREQRPGEVAFMNYNVAPIARYYTAHRQPPLRLQALVLQEPRASATDIFQDAIVQLRQQGTARAWILYDRADESASAFAATQGRVLKRHNFERGYVLLLQFAPARSAPARGTVAEPVGKEKLLSK